VIDLKNPNQQEKACRAQKLDTLTTFMNVQVGEVYILNWQV